MRARLYAEAVAVLATGSVTMSLHEYNRLRGTVENAQQRAQALGIAFEGTHRVALVRSGKYRRVTSDQMNSSSLRRSERHNQFPKPKDWRYRRVLLRDEYCLQHNASDLGIAPRKVNLY